MLNTVFREPPEYCLEEGEWAIPVSALSVTSPVSVKPLFIELYEGASPLDAFRDYCGRILQPVMHLFLRYGILLEAHPQNCLLAWDPKRGFRSLIARDFGGIRIHRPTLEARGVGLKVHPDRLTVTDGWKTARHRLIHSVFQWHLGQLAHTLSRAGNTDESPFWRVIKETTQACFAQHRDAVPDWRLNAEQEWLLGGDWPAKSSLLMRLAGSSEEQFVPAENPIRCGLDT